MPGFNSLYITEFNEIYDADHDGYLNLVSMTVHAQYSSRFIDRYEQSRAVNG